MPILEIDGLLASQVQALGEEVHRAGFDPREFTSTELVDNFAGYSPVPAVVHEPTGGSFAFARFFPGYAYSEHLTDLGHRVGLQPGAASPFEDRGPLEWPGVLRAFGQWLGYLRREMAVSDVWGLPPGTTFGLANEPSTNDERFSAEEQEALQTQLHRIEESLVEAAGEQRETVAHIRRELAELREELARMRKGRWKKFALGTLASIAGRGLVPPDALHRAAGALEHLFKSLSNRLMP